MYNVKEDFPIFRNQKDPYIYLDSAATTHKPQCVIDAVTDYYSFSYATVNRAIYSASHDISSAYWRVRSKVAAWIGARYDQEIVFTRGTTSSLNLLAIAANDSWLAGGTVVVSEAEHHANILSWEIACRRSGATVKKVRVNDEGIIDLSHLEKLLKQGVQLVSLAHVSNVSGAVLPVQEVAFLVHRYGALLAIDGAQGVGSGPLNLSGWDVDFYAFSGHKLYAPTGIGVLYGKRELLESLPPVEGGGDMVVVYDSESSRYQEPPLRFEAGTPHIAGVLGLGAAIDYLQALPFSVSDHLTALTRFLYNRLLTIPDIQIVGPQQGTPRGCLCSIIIPGVQASDLGFLLDGKGIAVRSGHQCSQPAMARWDLGHVLRASLGVYNDQQDVISFVEALEDILRSYR
ncbi:cysteine desulfurase [Chlamydia muridarum str. Nigg]|uniref:Probable cysteine desulfurase n=2 Tax=Chlamydia muridarum TaxID=83560 RepID=CSD_CHLMU|nr:cysteine desulfurase [Chlamydia muridarum]Q9PLP0.1 RecName: Full=Probable cysteine desulfurase [Chlamydia muridarum str. Nigg]AAF73526.1 aminotransferase, class V [Chlamydia muridarum str. Nigg]AHH22459.1 cysteine desulfurase [Chlamydia muridarum str. Nigg3 CMUT3-5]AHH23383.1 cysteine desulfurase [Chlamydia muridarum str. Nigg CM972]AID37610.1 cysteine desulfurase [Chlamydia muridarum str. Nigg 2 MCR]AIT90299.1 cysteine desulfurase [Chlamydia muridarum]